MNRTSFVRLLIVAAAALGTTAAAQEPPPEAAPVPDTGCEEDGGTVIELQALLLDVAASSGKEFLVDGEAQRCVFIGGTPIDEPTYPLLLSILRTNGLAGIEIEGRVNVVPAYGIRAMPLPLAQKDDNAIPDDAWVTRVIDLGDRMSAPQLVPILRPLLPREGHMAAFPETNKLLIADRYANVRRITEIVRTLTD